MFIIFCCLFVFCCFFRRSSSGDRLSVTPDNLSPSPSPGNLLANRGSPHSLSSIEVASTTVSGSGSKRLGGSRGGATYDSSTLPIRKNRGKVTAEEKNKKVEYKYIPF